MELVTTVVKKEKADSPVGLTLNYFEGAKIFVRCIFEESVFYNSSLKTGQFLVSINGKPVKGLSAIQVMELLAEAPAGELTVVSEDRGYHVTSLIKNPGDKLGVSLRERDGMVLISKLDQGGPLGGAEIGVGEQLISVNGASCIGLNKKQAVILLKELDELTIMTKSIGIMAVTVTKASKDSKVGIGIRSLEDNIIVTSLSETSLFAGTALKPGLKLVQVNGKDCAGLDRLAAIQLFKDAESDITVLVEDIGYVVATVKKESAESKAGIGMKTVDGDIVVSSVSPDGLFGSTDIVPGLKVLTVNDTLCTTASKEEAIAAIKEATGKLTMICESALKTITVSKDTKEAKLGVGLRSVNGVIIISSVSESGLFGPTDLKVGQKLISVGKKSVADLSKDDAIMLLKEAEGSVEVMVQDIGIVSVTVSKPTADTKVGIGLKDVGGNVHVSCIYDTGLFADTDLKDGYQLLAVNNTRIKDMDRNAAIQIFKEAEGSITVLAMEGPI